MMSAGLQLHRRLGFIGIGLLLAGLGVSLGFAWLRSSILQPFGSPGAVVVTIETGASGAAIGQTLERAGIIRSQRMFRWWLRFQDRPYRLQAGEYEFELPMSLSQVTSQLHLGQVLLHKVTVPEGLDMREIVQVFSGNGFGMQETFEGLLGSADLIADLDPVAVNLEGYLFPDTYLISRSMDEEQIIRAMLQRTRDIWTPERRAAAEALGLSLRDVLTLASLVEKEAQLAEERSLVSAVFHNRLEKGMKLACDPTVIYAVKLVKEYDGIIHRSDLQLDSPYNTYLYPGLPPGPIASPGLAAIEAALAPAESDYLYFVARNDGSHVFSRTYREHHRAVLTYQR